MKGSLPADSCAGFLPNMQNGQCEGESLKRMLRPRWVKPRHANQEHRLCAQAAALGGRTVQSSLATENAQRGTIELKEPRFCSDGLNDLLSVCCE